MENPIAISKINDFIFCPMSLYYHSIYEHYDDKIYHGIAQQVGKIKHENIDEARYISSANIMQGTTVYCDKYNLVGKIDLYDSKKFELVERKYKIKTIYDGYKFQLYAQMFCLEEMGFRVDRMFIHSLSDNKRYEIIKPSKKEIENFETTIEEMIRYLPNSTTKNDVAKCQHCIYAELCGETGELC